jgi:alanine dehydrogenase
LHFISVFHGLRCIAMPNNAQLLLLDKHAVAALLQPEQVLAAVREAFVLHSQRGGRVFPLVREALPTGGVFGIKSGDVPAQHLLGLKAAGFWPANRLRGLEAHQATIVLIDPATGRPECVIDGNAVTTMRTGAAGALGLMLLARPDSQRLCVFGTGVQARVQLAYALDVLPLLTHISYVSSSGEPDPSFEALFSARCHIEPATGRHAAVAASDVVITATTGGGPLFDCNAVGPGTHLNCVGADTQGKRELPAGSLERGRLFVDDHAQAQQVGETQWQPETPCTELGDLLDGKHFQRAPTDITIFDMTGLALQDLTVARMLQQRAAVTGAGCSIAWPW